MGQYYELNAPVSREFELKVNDLFTRGKWDSLATEYSISNRRGTDIESEIDLLTEKIAASATNINEQKYIWEKALISANSKINIELEWRMGAWRTTFIDGIQRIVVGGKVVEIPKELEEHIEGIVTISGGGPAIMIRNGDVVTPFPLPKEHSEVWQGWNRLKNRAEAELAALMPLQTAQSTQSIRHPLMALRFDFEQKVNHLLTVEYEDWITNVGSNLGPEELNDSDDSTGRIQYHTLSLLRLADDIISSFPSEVGDVERQYLWRELENKMERLLTNDNEKLRISSEWSADTLKKAEQWATRILERAAAELALLNTEQAPQPTQGPRLRFKPYKKQKGSDSGPSETEILELAYALWAKGDLVTESGVKANQKQVYEVFRVVFGVGFSTPSKTMTEIRRRGAGKTGRTERDNYPQSLAKALELKLAQKE